MKPKDRGSGGKRNFESMADSNQPSSSKKESEQPEAVQRYISIIYISFCPLNFLFVKKKTETSHLRKGAVDI